nr:glucose/ribitol dehydrogenase [Tanacetum cinerariifolium]
ASKAALISFYESLRFEVSPTITITILTLGFVNTNLITAKYSTNGVGVPLSKDIGSELPTMDVEPCTKAIVDGVCKGATSITEPRKNKIGDDDLANDTARKARFGDDDVIRFVSELSRFRHSDCGGVEAK